MTTLSAIVATRDRPELLRDCLGTLTRQGVGRGELQILVVDDGSRTDLTPVVAEFDSSPVVPTLLRQEPGGLSRARNTGAAAAEGEVLAYLDDDTLVSPGWATAVLSTFRQMSWNGLAGRIELRLEGPEPTWLTGRLRTYLSELDLGEETRWLEDDTVPYGANCAITAASLRSLGGFRESLGRDQRSLVSNEELDLFRRLRAGGGRIAYCPDAHVLHRVPPERLTPAWFMRRAYAQGVSDVLVEPALGRLEAGRRLVLDGVRAVRAVPMLAKNVTRGQGTVSAGAWLSWCRGRVSSRLRARRG